MPAIEAYAAAARRAATSWGLEPIAVDLLNHSENVVLRLGLPDDGQVVMRLHRPGYNSLDELESEVAWVRSLADAGLPVPTAVPMLGGGHYRLVDVVDADDAVVEQRQVGVVEWIDGAALGDPLGESDAGVVVHFRTVGELTARIRAHGTTWKPPAGFTRRRWDAEGFVGEQPLWGRFWEVDALTEAQRSLFGETRERLLVELTGLSTGPDRFGLIHADLHLGNLMVDGDDLTMIDFDDSGWGWWAHELAIAVNPAWGEPWYDEAKAALLDGYRSVHPIDDDEVALIDTFLTVRALMIVGWLAARPELDVYQYLGDVASEAEEACELYLGS